jgi:aminomethyltransferase
MSQRTCLYHKHKELGGKIVEFAGYEMPIQYKGIIEEHVNTRTSIGLFDVSHMGKIYVNGSQSEQFLNYLVTNNVKEMNINQAIYSPMCQYDGGVIDDILIYKLADSKYLLVVNASNTEKVLNWMDDVVAKYQYKDVHINHRTKNLCQLAIQGPKSVLLLSELFGDSIKKMKYYYCNQGYIYEDTEFLVSRTGYTGEDGFEVYFDSRFGERFFDILLQKGRQLGIMPCGLGCRDTLRFEAGMPLYGNELGETINPIEAGLSYFIDFNKSDFIGMEALKLYKQSPKRKIVGFRLLERGMARQGVIVYNSNEVKIGQVTTGYKSPSYKDTLGFALIDQEYLEPYIYLGGRKGLIKAERVSKRFKKTYESQ